MNEEEGLRHAQAVAEMYDSLHKSIDQAGGSGASFTADYLCEMTVMNLISKLASNKIRFVYIGSIKKAKTYKPKGPIAKLTFNEEDEDDMEGVSAKKPLKLPHCRVCGAQLPREFLHKPYDKQYCDVHNRDKEESE
jgi:hypothetical protein